MADNRLTRLARSIKFQLHLNIGDKVEWTGSRGYKIRRGRVVSCDTQYADPTDLVCVKLKNKNKIVFIKRSRLKKR